MHLSTSYLGLTLAHPFMAGACPLSRDLDMVRRLEDGGSAAIVLPSLFEEQITLAESGKIHYMDPFEAEFADLLANFPTPAEYVLAPDEYLEHLRRVKAAVGIPVIASVNGTTSAKWLKSVTGIEQAGADALELNVYEVDARPDQSAATVETRIRDVVVELKRSLKIPIAVKLTPFFTAFGHLARQLDLAAVDGLILFNRFYQPDIDVRGLTAAPRLELSTSSELRLRLRWVSVLRSHVRCSLAITGGVALPTDGVKAILAGADAVQIVSAILRHGPHYLTVMRDGLARWMESKRYRSIDDVRGRVSIPGGADASLVERANYIRTLHSRVSGT